MRRQPDFEELPPEPYTFIKSIAEQGYTIPSAIADLIDNSITASASRIEILVDQSSNPFKVFIADDGNGMNEETLHANMRFPSNDPEKDRRLEDLGRFGLGMKTASFSQTRKFTVISKAKGAKKYACRTWDLDELKKGKWNIIKNDKEEIDDLLSDFYELSRSYNHHSVKFVPNTLIVWHGLFKIDRLKESIELKKEALRAEFFEDAFEHLEIVFHRSIHDNGIVIRLNNGIIKPFNPFPEDQSDFRILSCKRREYKRDLISIQGYILPSRAIRENKEGLSVWTQKKKSLTDMEGIYVYRNGRLIIMGGWNRFLKKSPQFQLGRIKVEIGNDSDELFQLNVSKSSLKIPFEIKQAFLRTVAEVKNEAYKEYKNRIHSEVIDQKEKSGIVPLVSTGYDSSGITYSINEKFPLIEEIFASIPTEQKRTFRKLIQILSREINELISIDDKKSSLYSSNRAILTAEEEEDREYYLQLFKRRGYSEERIRIALRSIFAINK